MVERQLGHDSIVKPTVENRCAKAKDRLNVYYTNCRSISNKIDLLRGLACVENFDVIALTETWLDLSGKVFHSEIQIDGYTLFHKDRTGRRGGGVAVYIRDTLQCCVNNSIRLDDKTESIWIDLKEGAHAMLLGVIYRPPNTCKEDSMLLWQEISKASKYNNLCVLGDFNLRNIDWNLMIGDNEADDFLNVIQDNFLKQVILEPTRGDNVLDLALINREELVQQVEVGGKLGNSDHSEIRLDLKWSETRNTRNKSKVPDFRKADYDKLREYLQGVNWPGVVRSGEVSRGLGGQVRSTGVERRVRVESQVRRLERPGGDGRIRKQVEEVDDEVFYDHFVKELLKGQVRSIPYREIRSKNNDPKWMNSKLKHYIGLKRNVYKKLKAGQEELRAQYNELARTVKKLTRSAKNNYEIKVAKEAKTDPKGFFQVYRTKNRETVGPLKSPEGQLVSSGEEMSGVLNDYFLTVFTHENKDIMPDCEPHFSGVSSDRLTDISITQMIVKDEIDRLKRFKSPGPDEVYPRVLKESRDVISEPLANIFRNSLDLEVVPLMWRQANVVPIHKKGDKSLMSNYRPVSLTSIVGKIMETLIAGAIRKHLDKYNLIKDSQHGFMKGRSCLTNLLSFYRSVYEAADNGDSYDIVYLDFSKAFDKVPHQRLLDKVRAHGIDGKVLGWIKSWISDRQQRVVINGCKSKWGKVISGVPQGSVLGPLLFLIYINDLDSGVSSHLSKFADDTKIGRIIRSDEDTMALQADLEIMYEWADKWQMQFNISKCKVLSIGRDNPHNRYTLNNEDLVRLESEKDLGVTVTSDLRQRKQCVEARNKANRVLGFILRSVKSRSPEVILKLYLALVRPHLDYAVQFWSPYYRKDIGLLESVQRRMTKKIQGMHNIPYERRLKLLDLHSLERRRIRGDMIEVFKWQKGYNKGDVDKILKVSGQARTRNNGFKLEKVRFRREIGRYWFSNRVVDDWNRLSREVVSAESLGSFKRRLDKCMDRDDRWT